MFNDRTAKFLLLAALVICVGGAFAPNWIVNQFMFGFSRALAILGLMVIWRTGLVSFGRKRLILCAISPSNQGSQAPLKIQT